VAGVVKIAVERIERELMSLYPNVDGVVGLEHSYGCGVAIDAPGAEIPIRTLRHISLNPNFGGEVMVVSLGCEKLQPDRLLPPGSFPILDQRNAEEGPDLVCLQDDAHVGQDGLDLVLRALRIVSDAEEPDVDAVVDDRLADPCDVAHGEAPGALADDRERASVRLVDGQRHAMEVGCILQEVAKHFVVAERAKRWREGVVEGALAHGEDRTLTKMLIPSGMQLTLYCSRTLATAETRWAMARVD
jgi:hypothetical protein